MGEKPQSAEEPGVLEQECVQLSVTSAGEDGSRSVHGPREGRGAGVPREGVGGWQEEQSVAPLVSC